MCLELTTKTSLSVRSHSRSFTLTVASRCHNVQYTHSRAGSSCVSLAHRSYSQHAGGCASPQPHTTHRGSALHRPQRTGTGSKVHRAAAGTAVQELTIHTLGYSRTSSSTLQSADQRQTLLRICACCRWSGTRERKQHSNTALRKRLLRPLQGSLPARSRATASTSSTLAHVAFSRAFERGQSTRAQECLAPCTTRSHTALARHLDRWGGGLGGSELRRPRGGGRRRGDGEGRAAELSARPSS